MTDLEGIAGRITRFRAALARDGFEGDFEQGLGAREVAATDNSIYQVRPAAIVYPRADADLNRIVRAAAAQNIALAARGGNTGTNGQSLGRGVIIDFARYKNRVTVIDAAAGLVVVEPGVVLDQLNVALEEHGLFFPPMVSTASRATIGGMVATDASGKGSRQYGKTSDYIAAIDVVLSNGNDWHADPMTRGQAELIAAGTGLVADIHHEALRVAIDQAEEIRRVFPDMNRGLTGYNLQKLYQADHDRFFLGYLLAGSEGTLALTKSITLRVIRKPTMKALAVIRYAAFDQGLRDVGRLLQADPLAIEILDDKVLGVAQSDIVWAGIGAILGDAAGMFASAMNFVEFAGFDQAELDRGVARLTALMDMPVPGLIDWTIVRDPQLIAQLWSLREKSVGLLARLGGGRQGMPFVEDTAVPPHRLADYVAEFRALLDGHGLHYGMFGHADVGCLHVRPFLDMRDPAQAALIRPISDAVAVLTKSYGGLLWGEHGRGFRGEYSPFFFGPVLYAELERIKQAFDPRNLFNPGKLATPRDGSSVDRIDRVPLRGALDAKIMPELLAEFDRAVACNGNGACFSWDALDTLCPSYKATRDRAQSPKGRAALLRAWARLSAEGPQADLVEIEHAVAASLSTCLSCKACTTLCPVNVDVPTMKSRFLARYYGNRRRPASHRLLAEMEALLGWARRFPRMANLVGQSGMARAIMRKAFGLIDLPRVALARQDALPPIANSANMMALSEAERRRTVVLVEDTFTTTFDGRVLDAAIAMLQRTGYHLFRMPAQPNGKVLHVLGRRDQFAALAHQRVRECAALAVPGVRLVGLDAATALMHEQEYREFTDSTVTVIGLERLLRQDIDNGLLGAGIAPTGPHLRLLGHCTEQALRPQASGDWIAVLAHFGVAAEFRRTGCCGMAGLFGHEQKQTSVSQRLFDLSWRDALGTEPDTVLATGYSCRSQAKRMAGFRPRHPIELLAHRMVGPFAQVPS